MNGKLADRLHQERIQAFLPLLALPADLDEPAELLQGIGLGDLQPALRATGNDRREERNGQTSEDNHPIVRLCSTYPVRRKRTHVFG